MSKIGDILDWSYMIQKKIEDNGQNEALWLSEIYELAEEISRNADELENKIKELSE